MARLKEHRRGRTTVARPKWRTRVHPMACWKEHQKEPSMGRPKGQAKVHRRAQGTVRPTGQAKVHPKERPKEQAKVRPKEQGKGRPKEQGKVHQTGLVRAHRKEPSTARQKGQAREHRKSVAAVVAAVVATQQVEAHANHFLSFLPASPWATFQEPSSGAGQSMRQPPKSPTRSTSIRASCPYMMSDSSFRKFLVNFLSKGRQ